MMSRLAHFLTRKISSTSFVLKWVLALALSAAGPFSYAQQGRADRSTGRAPVETGFTDAVGPKLDPDHPKYRGVPRDAVDYLNTLPRRKVTLDFVVGRALGVSDAYQVVKSTLIRKDVPLLSAQSALDYQLTGEFAYTESELEPLNTFGSPTSTQVSSYKLGVSTYFRTGTLLGVEVEHGFTDLEFASSGAFTVPPRAAYQTVLRTTIAQNLWRDAFGQATRQALEAGRASQEATELQFREGTEEFVLALINQYYMAWLAQAQVDAAEQRLQRQRRLMSITNTKRQLGTAEAPDVLQVEAATINVETGLEQARESLGNIWRALATALKFPKTWLGINPSLIPLVLEGPSMEAQKLCSDGKNGVSEPPASSTLSRRYALQAKATALRFEAAKNLAKPQLQLFGALAANGVDDERSATVSETTSFEHPSYTVGLRLNWPLGGYNERASAQTAAADAFAARAQADQAQGELRVEWLNTCLELTRLDSQVKALFQAEQRQSRRAGLEERRFQIGRTVAFNVIQAENDMTAAELASLQAVVEKQNVAWRVLRLAGQMEPFLKTWLESLKTTAGPDSGSADVPL